MICESNPFKVDDEVVVPWGKGWLKCKVYRIDGNDVWIDTPTGGWNYHYKDLEFADAPF